MVDSKLVAAFLLAKHARGKFAAAARCVRHGRSRRSVNAIVRALAIELAPIRVNALSPGWVDTPMSDRMAPLLALMTKDAVFEVDGGHRLG